jgi:hypothetical protein
VSTGNKASPEARDQFTAKVAALLRQQVCVCIVDIVMERRSNLYAELLTRLKRMDPHVGDPPPAMYVVTLRTQRLPKRRHPQVDAWYTPLMLGQPLPTVPPWLSSTQSIELPLEPSYQETCRLLRIA